ncbi:MAG: TspO protein [Chloroflexi bacterium RBG_13_52_14]|nr:MAG: TspO protein [Chloroflexi bacterium RBG_13_52_14]
MSSSEIIKLIVSIVVCEGAGGIGGFFTRDAIPTWYAGLKKPAFVPPNSAFAPIWISLYLMMSIAVYFVWREGLHEEGVELAFTIFWIQLLLNVLWTVVFFGLKSLFGGLVVILLLWVAILVSIIEFFGVSPMAGALLIPYIVWVSIAANLNVRLWLLNR